MKLYTLGYKKRSCKCYNTSVVMIDVLKGGGEFVWGVGTSVVRSKR